MASYLFLCGGREHKLTMSKYDAKLKACLNPYVFPNWRNAPFWSHEQRQPKRLSMGVAMEDLLTLLRRLEHEQSLLQFQYGLQRNGLPRRGWVNQIDCDVGGVRATALGGPGVCCVESRRLLKLDSEAIDELVATGMMRQDEAELARTWNTSIDVTKMLHDLRDMKPFCTDDGHTLQAVRRAHPTDIVGVVRGLVSFLESVDGEEFEVVYRGA